MKIENGAWHRFLVASLLAMAATVGVARPVEPMAELDAWDAARLMGVGVNIGNTLENTTQWETGWGNPRITKEFVDSLAALGFKTVRLPVAWDTYARDGRIQQDKLERVGEVVDWITSAGMFCVVNIHWDGGWIDSSQKDRFPKTFATFSAEAETKYRSYWNQIATFLAGKNERVIFEALNEETNFEKAGSSRDAYATLTQVNQLFIDTVRKTSGNNAKRLLLVTGYGTDITKTTNPDYVLPADTVPHKLLISVHYYTPWQFAGMTEDASWGKVQATWGSPNDVAELNRLFDAMQEYSKRNDIPAFIGEFGVTDKKEAASRVRWMSAVAQAALTRKMVPVLWDTGGDISRKRPYAASAALREVLQKLPGVGVGASASAPHRSLIQPVQWIIRESTTVDMWAYVAPDGETVTFSRAVDKPTFELLATDTNGRQPQPFLKAPPAASITRGAWSRTHNRLAFTGSENADVGTGLYIADARGENVRRVPTKGLSGRFLYPSWLPDGRSVVVVDAEAAGGSTLFRVDLESGDSSALTKPSEVLVGMPSVSPDGTAVAFAGQLNEGQQYDQTKNQIWLMPIGGGKPLLVSAGTGRQPDWSPDGRWLAFTSGRDDATGRHAVFIVNRDGGNLTQLTDHSVNPQHPVWSPDGKWIVFSAQVTEKVRMFGLARITVPKLTE